MKNINWLKEWFKSYCNEDWEYENQIQIYTVSNPGWVVKIGLLFTPLENLKVDYKLDENSENDWYGISVKNSVFEATGDIDKLNFLIEKFKEIVEEFTGLNSVS